LRKRLPGMKIRGKLLSLLLLTALLPLLLSGLLHRSSMRALGSHLAAESKTVLADNAFRALQDVVDDYGRVLQRDRKILLLGIQLQAREAERRLTGNAANLRPMAEVYRFIREFQPDLISAQVTVLESGPASRQPERGDLAPGSDPRQALWYQRTKEAKGLTWTFLPDSAGEFLKLYLSVPVFGANGSFAGATAIAIPFVEAFRELKQPEQWASQAETFLVSLVPSKEGKDMGLRVALVREGQPPGTGWRRPNGLRYLTSEDARELQGLIADAAAGRSGVRKMRFQGAEALWAYGIHEAGTVFPLIIVPYQRVLAQAEASEQYILTQTRDGLKATGAIMLVVTLVVILLALQRSQALTNPVRRLTEAATQLIHGDFEAKVNIRTGDELQDLGIIFNDLGPQLLERERMKQSLILAQGVQQHLLPAEPPTLPGFDLFGRSAFCDETGGDYFDFIELAGPRGKNLGLIVGDVSGHGVGAALHMAFARGVIRAVASHFGTDLEKPFLELNRHLLDSTDESEFMTLFYGALNPEGPSLSWNSAGHGPVLRYDSARRVIQELPTTGPPLGILADASYEPAGPLPLGGGDALLIGTDGIWEAQDEQGEMFGIERLREVLLDCVEKPAADIYQEILAAVGDFCVCDRPKDDMTLVVVKVL